MIAFTFNFLKSLQASKLLIEQEGGCTKTVRLLKLLYIADRELLAETGRTLTGDEAVAMPRGPVLKNVHALIKREGAGASSWNSVIHKNGSEVSLVERGFDPGTGKLTDAELDKLKSVSERFRGTSDDHLIEVTHGFREWIDAFDDKNPDAHESIKWETALIDLDAADMIQEIESDLDEQKAFRAALQGAAC